LTVSDKKEEKFSNKLSESSV